MSLMYLSDRALAQLRRDFARNGTKYAVAEPWVGDATLGAGWCRESGIEIAELPLLQGTAPKDDFESTRLIYTALQKLTPVQAMDERLWAYLTHVTYWKYNVERWGNRSIQARFLFKSRGIGGLVLNGISRLWWFGRVSHDPNRADPWELTKSLLSFQDIQTGLLQRTIGRSENIRTASLRFFASHKDKLEELGSSGTIQKLCVDLNLAGGACLLDATPQDQIMGMLSDSLAAIEQEGLREASTRRLTPSAPAHA